MSKATYRLLLIRNGSAALREYRFSKLHSILAVVLAVAVFSAIVFSLGQYLADQITRVSMAELEGENNDLRRQIKGLQQHINDVDRKINDLYAADDELRIMADMPKIDEDVRQVGIGGVISPGLNFSHNDASIGELIFDLDKIEREIKLQRASFMEIEKQFIAKADLISHTPSIKPVRGGHISSKFGYRNDPFTGKRKYHSGLDFSIERGSPIMATADGNVVFAKRSPGLGNLVIVDHGYGFRTAYGHMDRILVRKGQSVTRGMKLGEVGSTGRSTAPHLHYEVHVDRKAVDPTDYIFEGFADINRLK